MIKEKPLFGFGFNGFSKFYMDFQADFLCQSQSSQFQMLADNINNPLNEFLLVAINFGLVGLVILLMVLVRMLIMLWKKDTNQSLLSFSIVFGFCVSSFFSYPLRYPATFFGLFYVVCCCVPYKLILKFLNGKIVKILPIVFFLMVAGEYWTQREWYDASHSEDFQSCIRQYQSIYPVMRKSYKFLYNYSYTLYRAGLFEEAEKFALQSDCRKKDYNTILLLGKINEHKDNFLRADSLYTRAHYMCPSKFTPLYFKFLLYKDIDPSCAREYAIEIVEKKAKIPSDQLLNIKFEARKYLYGKDH